MTTLSSKIMIVVAMIRPSRSVVFACVQVFSSVFIVILFKCVSDVIVNNNVIIHILSIVYRICAVGGKKEKDKKFR